MKGVGLLIWDEAMLKYAARRMCDKHKPRNCNGCDLKKKTGSCKFGLGVDAVKEWGEKNIPKDVLEGRRATK